MPSERKLPGLGDIGKLVLSRRDRLGVKPASEEAEYLLAADFLSICARANFLGCPPLYCLPLFHTYFG